MAGPIVHRPEEDPIVAVLEVLRHTLDDQVASNCYITLYELVQKSGAARNVFVTEGGIRTTMMGMYMRGLKSIHECGCRILCLLLKEDTPGAADKIVRGGPFGGIPLMIDLVYRSPWEIAAHHACAILSHLADKDRTMSPKIIDAIARAKDHIDTS